MQLSSLAVPSLAPVAPTAVGVSPLVEAWTHSRELAVVTTVLGEIVAVNQAFARKFGRPVAEWPHRSFPPLIHPEDAPSWHAAGRWDRPPHHLSREHRWQTAQGWRWIAWEETLLPSTDEHPALIRAIGRDVTKRRLGEEHFAKLACAVDQAPVSIVMAAPDGRVQYVNPKFTRNTGFTLEEIFERDLRLLEDGHPDDSSVARLREAMTAGRDWHGELRTKCKDGRTLWELVQVCPVRNPAEEVTHFLCLREDISSRKRLEEQLRQSQKMESLGTLAGGIAHDFNNLVAIMQGFTELALARSKDDGEQQRFLGEVFDASQRAAGLVRQILAFSCKTEIAYRPADLNRMITDLGRMLRETFPRTIEFRFDLERTLPTFAIDPNQIQQVLMNLCVNARDAMPGGGRIELRTARLSGRALAAFRADPEQDYVRIDVADTGVGMTPEVKHRIFEPFFTTKQGQGGTGLGLSVAYGIVVNHRGFIDVTSIPDHGSTFHLYLPITSRATTSAPPRPRAQPDVPRGSETLLVVEDEPSLRNLLTTVLRGAGYQVHAVADGASAVEFFSRPGSPVDAVLLDLNLPRLNGVDVYREMQKLLPGTRTLILSGHLTPETRETLRMFGEPAFLDKPYSLGDLGRCLRALIEAPVA